MTRIRIIFVLCLVIVSFAVAQQPVETALLALEKSYAEAVKKQDEAVLNNLLAEDFVAISSGAEVRDRAKEIADIKGTPDYVVEAFDLDEVAIRIFGIAAIATGKSTLITLYKGERYTLHFRYTRVYAQRSGRWWAVAQQLTRIPQKR